MTEEDNKSRQNLSTGPGSGDRDNTNVDAVRQEQKASLGKQSLGRDGLGKDMNSQPRRTNPSSGALPGIDPNIPRTPLKEKYEFLTVLGAGGAGVIYKAKQQPLGRLVAVKMVHSHLMSTTAMKRFQQEAKTISTLAHPNIISVYDFGVSDENQPFMVMDYVEGTVLSEILNDVGQLPASMVKQIAIQLCEGLSHAHMRGILHRDLKPSNIMIVQMETGQQLVKILDFGLAKVLFGEEEETEHLTKTGETVGTPAFMSPEQVMGKQLDHRSDLYSLGCVMYHCIVGDPPFVGETKMETMLAHLNTLPEPINTPDYEKVSPYLEAIVMKLLQKHPADRFQSMWDLKEALEGQEQLVMPAGGWNFGGDDDDEDEDQEEEDQYVSVAAPAAPPSSSSATPVQSPPASPARQTSPGREASLETIMVEDVEGDGQSGRKWILILVCMIFVTGIMSSLVFFSMHNNNQQPVEERTPKKKSKKSIVRGSGEDPFDETVFSDQALKAHINDNRFIRNLHTHEAITDNALIPAVEMPNLAELDLSGTPVTEKVLTPLKGKTSLAHFRLSKTRVGDEVVNYLATFPNLASLDLSNNSLITDGFMAQLSHLPTLNYLNLNGDQISDESVVSLSSLKNLNELHLGGTQVGDKAMENIRKLQSIRRLDLSNTRVTDEGAQKLVWLKQLEEINLAGTGITDRTAKLIATMPYIQSLDLSGTKVTDQTIIELRKLKGLNKLKLVDCNISRKAVNEFQRENPACALEMTPEETGEGDGL